MPINYQNEQEIMRRIFGGKNINQEQKRYNNNNMGKRTASDGRFH